ncbi:SDR family NAD(P)-dependent oxidoreductase [Chitinophaga varians]|uniref:SDR family NAD(P)-dependent oxidoreductase n=1 Tax=Chitinophaga varians TaxID=2202339 RepID=UPI00165F8F55|nr:SDR family NAD(P)-dependent oxidoreductase [Chitinophaga varians]MBC9915647.1 SDR family NAD(P)-dependent oxidoreductase [Chitinophaga varians]
MLKLLKFCCHGYVAVPIIEACAKQGLFALLDENKFSRRTALMKELHAQEGYFSVALQALESLGWLEKNDKDAYRLTSRVGKNLSDQDLTAFYAVPPKALLQQQPYARQLAEKIEKLLLKKQDAPTMTEELQQGALVALLMAALLYRDTPEGEEDSFAALIGGLDKKLVTALGKLFTQERWVTPDKSRLTPEGRYMLQAGPWERLAACHTMLRHMSGMLFGDGSPIPGLKEAVEFINRDIKADTDKTEEGVLPDFRHEITTVFNQLPIEKQPRAIVMDGVSPAVIADIIHLDTWRGRQLNTHPLMLICINGDNATTLPDGMNYHTISADIHQPHEIREALNAYGLAADGDVCYIHAFSHRRVGVDVKQEVNEAVTPLVAGQPEYYIGRDSQLLHARTVLSYWRQHLQNWAGSIGKSPLLILASHPLPVHKAGEYLDRSESFYLDTIRGLTQQQLISAEAFLILAANAGLFNQYQVKRYPRLSAFCVESLHHLAKRDYQIRFATEHDVESLIQLESLCWAEQLRTSRAQLLARVQQYPQGQFVLEKEGQVLGVIYSQRIANDAALENYHAGNVHELHDPGGAIIQLIAVNIHPDSQQFGYGDQLLEFMLQRCSLVPGIVRVVAVSLCKKYDAAAGLSMEQYIRLKDNRQDPILAFHDAHGASIVKPMANYRPLDYANQGYGVLVMYDILNRVGQSGRSHTVTPPAKEKTMFSQADLRQFLQEKVAALLDIDVSAEFDRPVMEMGLNSVDLMALQKQIERKYQLELQPGFFFEYNNLDKVMAYLSAELAAANDTAAGDAVTDRLPAAAATADDIPDTDIAIIGISCKLPGGIESADDLWRVLASGECMISRYPQERGEWPAEADYPGIGQGGFLHHADAFDAAFFRMSPKEAQITDPQQRMLLQLAWGCLEDAAIVPATLKGTDTGVFIGASNCDYSRLMQAAGMAPQAHHAIGGSLAVLANRLSYFFDFNGPSLTIDTACSASLVALHTALRSLHAAECSTALVGGVNFICHPELSIAYQQAGMLAPDARCKVFDATANGYVRAEGAVMLLLKPLRQAMADGNHIHAVIKGSAVNHGGLGGGLTVPNPQKQSELYTAAWKNAGIRPQQLSYIEAHGTGTSLGDPIEIQGIKTAYYKSVPADWAGACAIGSVKSNLGHLESAAGITGLLKVVLAMQHRQLPASINYQTLNPKIHLQDTGFHIQHQPAPWKTPYPLLAGVSSFGSGGANAHVVVQELLEAAPENISLRENLFVLSAFSKERLQDYAAKVLEWMANGAGSTDFTAALYSWQTGRTAMKHRLAIRVSDWQDLQQQLQQWLTGAPAIDIWTGTAGQPAADTLPLSGSPLAKMALQWVTGHEVAWSELYTTGIPRLISLPVYPFSKERHWIPVAPKAPTAVATVASSLLPATDKGPATPKQVRIPDAVGAGFVFQLPEIQKPTKISLMTPGALNIAAMQQRSGNRVAVILPDTALATGTPEEDTTAIQLFDHGNGVYVISISGPVLSGELVAQLRHALTFVQQLPAVKVLMLQGGRNSFLQGGRGSCNEAVKQQLYQAIVAFPHPVIAAMEGDAAGAGFLAGALCDFMICSLEGTYSYTDTAGGLFPTIQEELLFRERFGQAAAGDFLYHATASTGKELQRKGWSCPMVPAAEVISCAHQLASDLASRPAASLHLLKKHLGRHIAALTEKLTIVEAWKNESAPTGSIDPITSGSHLLKLSSAPAGILTIDLHFNTKKFTLKNLVAGLKEVITQVNQGTSCKAIVLYSNEAEFIPVSATATTAAEVRALTDLLLSSAVPVVTALEAGAGGIGWLISQYSDACIYNETAVYTLSGLLQIPQLAQSAAAIFSYTLGRYTSQEILMTGKTYTGRELQQLAPAAAIAGKGDVLAKAKALAASMTRLPSTVVRSWKRDRVNFFREKIQQQSAWPEKSETAAVLPAPGPVALRSAVIGATVHPAGILEVKMEDREAKNMFSDAFIDGIREVFAHIAANPVYKVVVLTGYDNYFASGGTKEMLLDIQDGKMKFTDAKIYHLAMECSIPVIAAMQGHGIGAGWSIGMFADIILFSEESHYVSPYMRYGFTPGAGANLIFPDKTGYDLARETLLTAVEYTGSRLRERGMQLPVLSRKKIHTAAFALAETIAQNSRESLVTLKQQLTAHLHRQLEENYALELAMHEQTFVGSSETLKEIENNFSDQQAAGETPVANSLPHTPSSAHLLAAIAAGLKTLLAQELHMEEAELDESRPFVELGLDSITGVTFIRKINEKYKTAINATKVYSYPNLAQFSLFVKEEAEKHGTLPADSMPEPQAPVDKPETVAPQNPRTASNTAAPAKHTTEAIAVIGMAGQFPEANDVEAFWQNIAAGKNCIREVPAGRWDMDKYYQPGSVAPGKTYSKWMGALDEYDLFDPLFFNISPSEAERMDPQQRLFLQTCWHAIEHAGYNASSLAGSKCGVFAGCGQGDYHLLSRELQISAQGFTGGDNSILAARISYFLNLQGPSLSIDTACSSSLVAIAHACDSLVLGKSDMALAGGVYIAAGADMHIKTAQMGMLSPDGRCYTFDQRANGFVPGEGVGVVLLKRLEDAARDQDNILGVIRGWGTNQDGKTNGITAPNAEAQTLLQQDIYDKYKIDPAAVQLVEAHGTGTKLGDPIEVEALVKSFTKYTSEKAYCALGSVKSNIGHCLMAAGVAGVIKLLMALKYKQLPPAVNFEKLNEHISLDNSPFYVNTTLKAWELPKTAIRTAAISSFGFSGTNAHLVIAEHPALPETTVSAHSGGSGYIFPLSARTAAQLTQKVKDLLDYIHREKPTDPAAIAYTLQTGREAMEERLSVVAHTVSELTGKLQAYADGQQYIDQVFKGTKERAANILTPEVPEKWMQQQELADLASLWVKGHELDWGQLMGPVRPRKVSLPGYPFAKERYWAEAEADIADAAGAGPVLHPLLHRNTSVLHQQSYSTVFSGSENFLTHYPGNGPKSLPALLSLEMALAAVDQALPATAGMVELRNIIWAAPMAVTPQTTFSISLYENNNGFIDYEISSKAVQQEIIHSQGQVRMIPAPMRERVAVTQLMGQMKKGNSIISHQEIKEIYLGDNQVLACLKLTDHTVASQQGFILSPAVMEHIVRTADALRSHPRSGMPLSVQEVQITGACMSEMFILARLQEDCHPADETLRTDVELYDTAGNVCVQLKTLSLGSIQTAASVPSAETTAAQTHFFREYWREQSTYTDTAAAPGDLQMIIFTDKALRKQAAPALSQVVWVQQADSYLQATPQLYQCRPDRPEDISTILQQVATAQKKPLHIICTWAAALGEAGVHRLFDLLKAVKTAAVAVRRVTLLGCYHPAEADTCWDYAWIGFERSLKLTLPNVEVSILYTDTVAGISQQLRETTWPLRGIWWHTAGKKYLLSLESAAPDNRMQEAVLKQRGSYLITGGCGSLGLQFARYLAENYQANLLLVGRRPVNAAIEAQVRALKDAGAGEVYYHSADVGNRDALLTLQATLPFNLSGIIHAAGVEAAEPFYNRSTAAINQVLRPKTSGSVWLNEIFDQPSLDFICYFSSVAAFVGDFGSCDYAVASRFQMAYARHREQKGDHYKTTVINWPLWKEGGMTAGDAQQTAFYLKSSGQEPLQTTEGLSLWHDIMRSAATQTLVMLGVPHRIEQTLHRLYQPFAPVPENMPVPSTTGKGWKPGYEGLSLKECIAADLKRQVATLTKINQQQLQDNRNLTDYGFDSIGLSRLAKMLTDHFGVEVTPAIFFSATTIGKLSDYLIREHATPLEAFYRIAVTDNKQVSAAPKPAALRPLASRIQPALPAIRHQEPVAVIGMSGRFPQAENVQQFWDILATGKDAITEIPASRWDWRQYFTAPGDTNNRITTNKGGFIHGVDEFDPLFFEISPREAEQMDPAERLLLMEAYRAIEDARISPQDLRGQNVGVFVGMEEGQYDLLTGQQGITTSGNAMISSRLSYFLDLHGPAIATNTACSSGLVVLHQAVASLRQGECKAAMVAGISLLLSPESYVMMSNAGMLSEDGRCHTFSKHAGGIGVGESIVVLLLKPLSAAIADGDAIHGVIRASGINFDGKTNGVTAPNGDRQAELIERMYTDNQIDTRNLSYIVTHGTGTKLGDPVEINALVKAFKKLQGDNAMQAHCALTSCKSNVGHTLAASGLVSVVNLLKAMQHRQIPASLHCGVENDYISWHNSPFFINKETRTWKRIHDKPYMGAVSAFGRSGTNAHVVIEEYQRPVENTTVPSTKPGEKVMVLLSARTAEQLRQRVADVYRLVGAAPAIDLPALAYSLQVCREEFEVRFGLLTNSVEDLTTKLKAYLDGREDIEDTCQGKIKRNSEDMSIINDDDDMKEAIDKWIARRKLSKLLELWVKGLVIDWKKFYGDDTLQRIALPVYPFAKDRYWITATHQRSAAGVDLLHPLVHRNTADLLQQRYQSTFRGYEHFLGDATAVGHKIIPAGVYLEMARAAVQLALPVAGNNVVITLYDAVWEQPALISGAQNISIVLSADNDAQLSYEIGGDDQEVFFRGKASFGENPQVAALDIAALTAQLEADTANPDQMLYKGHQQLLLKLPSTIAGEYAQCLLHPEVMQRVLMACDVLAASLTPISVASLTVMSACAGELYAWIRCASGTQPGSGSVVLDIDLCDASGNVAVIITGLAFGAPVAHPLTTADHEWDHVSYLSRWEEEAVLQQPELVAGENILVVCCGGNALLEEAIRQYHRHASVTFIRVADKTAQLSELEWQCGIADADGFRTCLGHTENIDTLYFLSLPEQPSAAMQPETLVQEQESNEIQLLRLVKSLKQFHKMKDRVETYILTLDTQTIHGLPNSFTGAGITGLAYSLAQGNYQFRVRNLDLSSTDITTREGCRNVLEAVHHEPPADRGEVFKLFSGKRYRQTLFRLHPDTTATSAIRTGGVYLIVGGSGTIGKVITRHLIEKHDAEVVWMGRSEEASTQVQTALQQFTAYPGKLRYIQADVTDLPAMQQAVGKMKEYHPVLHGAVFAGMVFEFENSLDQTTEAAFRAIFDLKAHGSRIFYEALKQEPLDFMCYFSSGQAYAFSGAARLSAYASGITYADSLVQAIRRQAAFPVGIINWGFWKSSLGSVADNKDNFDALEDAQGYDCFARFVQQLRQGRVSQVLCMKASRHIESLMNCHPETGISLLGSKSAPAIPFPADAIDIPEEKIKDLLQDAATNELETWLMQLLYCEIDQLLKAAGVTSPVQVADLPRLCNISAKYISWWNTCLDMLSRHGFLQWQEGIISDWQPVDTATIRKNWQAAREKYLADERHRSRVTLVSDCLEQLPSILQGKVAATDVIFPNSTMEKVEGVYKNNLLSDTFNEMIANAVVAYIQQRLETDPAARLKILEIGAGTGGTSAIVFARLKPFRQSIEQYTYTDLSRAFFFHAEKNYVPDHPYIQCRRLDIEQPVAGQGIEVGTYDLVIATNVLHATRDIRSTLRHAKALLHQHGHLLLNELSTKTAFSHLTFGLLDGWWLFADAELRMPGSPGLYPATWNRVLQEEGFPSVLFPAPEMHVLGQQIMLAQSDGMIEQKLSVKQVNQRTPVIPAVAKEKQVQRPAMKPAVTAPLQDVSAYIRTGILNSLSATLKIPADSIDPDIAFSDYGIDSILGVSFINQINTSLTITLNTAVIFEHSSVNRLCKHIAGAYQIQMMAGMEKQPEQPVAARETTATVAYEGPADSRVNVLPRHRFTFRAGTSGNSTAAKAVDIAVIGISGVFPKAANIHEFWNNLITGTDGVDELPPHYLDQRHFFSARKQPGKTRCKWGGIIEDRDCFDPLFFNISPKEAESMNPHQRLVLQEGWKALEDAGYNPRSLSGTQTGIYIGAEPTGYIGDSFTGYSDAIIASRLSYMLNLNGPAFVVNTGCSSSAVALHLACESLRNKETDLAVAGGVNACLEQQMLVRLDEIEMLSPGGRCFTFDQAADGTIMSEGIGIVVLKRLEDAVAAGDRIYGLIAGSGVNQDGASNGITAPNGAAQEKLIVDVYRKFNINPEQISYVEAHGTGTRLGDPVETNALVRAFRQFTDNKAFCAVGSAKSYIGHTAAAAGVIGLIKVLLSMQHRQLPKLLNFTSVNPLIEFNASPFYINTAVVAWPSVNNGPRMAAVNSFGHSGTNVHLVVKEYLPATDIRRLPHAGTPVIILLSARTKEQLQQKATDLLQFLLAQQENANGAVHLVDLAYTLQVGREAMEERIGFIVSSATKLAEKLRAYIRGVPGVENIWVGQTRRNKDIQTLFGQDNDLQEIVEKWMAANKLSGLLDLWIKGLELDWQKLYPAQQPQRVHLPSYPFAKERYWLHTPKSPAVAMLPENTATMLHPLLHRNTSDLRQQSYTTGFSGEEFFLRDHQVNGRKVLPAVAYLEMARAAVMEAAPLPADGYMLELRNTHWLHPVIITGYRQVTIALSEDENGNIDFDICSQQAEETETVHCQGQVVIRRQAAQATLDLRQLQTQMQGEQLLPHTIYNAFSKMGIDYGPAHQGIITVHMGARQLLAHLQLPATAGQQALLLHPGMMDCALQACIGLMVDMNNLPSRPLLPFVLESVKIMAPCTSEMFVWARYAQDMPPGAKIVKVDIDLCDAKGNICVQLHGFSSRYLEDKSDAARPIAVDGKSYDDAFYNNVIDKILNSEMSAEEAAELN